MLAPSRSYLYAPGHRSDLHEKALGSDADAVIFDLEDAVTADERESAAAGVEQTLGDALESGKRIVVRVSGDSAGLLLLERHPDLTKAHEIMLGKVEEPGTIIPFAERLSEAPAPPAIVPLIETASSLWRIDEYCTARGVGRVQLGEADLTASLRIPRPAPPEALLAARSRIVLASAAFGLPAPVASVSTIFHDPEGLRDETLGLRALGLFGRTCIHPRQVAVVNACFTPSPTEVEKAQSIVAAARVDPGAFAVDGSMVDEAVVRHARATIALAEAYGVVERS